MNDNISAVKIISQGGLNTNDNFLTLSDIAPGAASTLINYEASFYGGYRRINGEAQLNNDSELVNPSDTEGRILGITVHNNSIFAARKNVGSSTYSLHSNDANGWNPVVTGFSLSTAGVSKLRSDLLLLAGDTYLITVDGGNNPYIFDGNTWYTLLSSNVGGTAAPGGDQLPLEPPSFVSVFQNHVFVAQGDIVAHSAPNDPFTWNVSAGAGQLPTGFRVVQIKPFRDELYIFGENRIKKIIVDSDGTFLLRDVSTNLGCIASDSVIEVAGNLQFLSSDGIRQIAGTERLNDVELSLLSRNITGLIVDLSNSVDLNNLNAVTIRGKTQFRYFFSDSVTIVPESRGILGSIRVGDQQNAGWEFAELVGLRASCTWSGNIGSVEYILIGDFNGGVYRQEVGSSFRTLDITAVYSTPYLDLGAINLSKTFRTLKTFVRAEGDLALQIGLSYDWESPYARNPANYPEMSENAVSYYDDPAAIWDDTTTVYGGASQPIFRTNIQGTGLSIQITYFTKGDISPYIIQGAVLEATARGRQ